MKYTLRLDGNKLDFDSNLFKGMEDIFAVKEMGKNGDNPHFHLVFDSKLKATGIRNRFKGLDYSVKEVSDLDTFLIYLCKDNNIVKYGQGVDKEKAEKLHKQFWDN